MFTSRQNFIFINFQKNNLNGMHDVIKFGMYTVFGSCSCEFEIRDKLNIC